MIIFKSNNVLLRVSKYFQLYEKIGLICFGGRSFGKRILYLDKVFFFIKYRFLIGYAVQSYLLNKSMKGLPLKEVLVKMSGPVPNHCSDAGNFMN